MSRTVRIIGAPTDYGANRRGVDMGPSAIRYAGLADAVAGTGAETEDVGDLFVARAEERDPDAAAPSGDAKFLREVEGVSEQLADEVAQAVAADQLPLVLGGDHSVAIGTLAGTGRDGTVGTVWFDAHGDFNTPSTSPSGNVHGMSLAAALGRDEFADLPWARSPGLREENVALVGLRSVDDEEREALRESDVAVYTMSDIDARGLTAVVDDALDVATAGVDGFHVSLDLDWLDPGEAPGVGTPVRGGVSYREAHAAMELVARRDDGAGADLRSLELVEVNPILDQHNETAELATELVSSALGKRII